MSAVGLDSDAHLNAAYRVSAAADKAVFATLSAGPTRGLFNRLVSRRRGRQDARILRELDPHLALDVGAAVPLNRRPAGFLVDPRPLWGIGLVPQPIDPPPACIRPAASDATSFDRLGGLHTAVEDGLNDPGANSIPPNRLLRWTLTVVALLSLSHLALHSVAPGLSFPGQAHKPNAETPHHLPG
jgi:hypothetical protein